MQGISYDSHNIASIFPKDNAVQSHWVNVFLGQKNFYPSMLVCGNSLPLSSPAKPSPESGGVGVAGHQKAGAAARGGRLSCVSGQGCQRAAFTARLPSLKLFQDKREQHT